MKKLLNEILKIILQVTPKDCVFSTSPHLRPPNLGSKLGGGGEGKKNQNAKIGQNRIICSLNKYLLSTYLLNIIMLLHIY